MARPKRTCTVDGCEKFRVGSGLCSMHYTRVRQRGTTALASSPTLTKTTEHYIWAGMKARCLNPDSDSYLNYGGRGITVCERWMDFLPFLSDMGPRPSPRHSLDRIDNDGNYEPGNCRWATATEQNRNNRNCRPLTHNGETLTVTEWAERLGMKRSVIYKRLRNGWSTEKALDPRRYTTRGKVMS